MSTSPAPAGPTTAQEPEPVITVISHTGLMYWWPVWLVGFILSGLTYLDGGHLAVVPEGTKVKAAGSQVYELTVPDRPGRALERAAEATARGEEAFPVRVSSNGNYGMVFTVLVLLVIVGSNVQLRGLWSVTAILFLFVLTLLLAYFDLWDAILERLGRLHIHITLAGYLLPSVVLLVVWLVSVFGFDRLRYIRFTAGQLVVHKDIGDAREVYDTAQITLQKRRSDLFRNWILGMGTGDLIVQIPNQNKEILLPNVVNVGRRIQQIADLMKTRPVIAG
jgi:hypothetical protein